MTKNQESCLSSHFLKVSELPNQSLDFTHHGVTSCKMYDSDVVSRLMCFEVQVSSGQVGTRVSFMVEQYGSHFLYCIYVYIMCVCVHAFLSRKFLMCKL